MSLATEETLLKITDPTKTIAITKSDATDLTGIVTNGIWVGGVGNVAIQLVGDSAPVTLLAVAAGTRIPGSFARVMSTNTTATAIIGFGR